MAIDYEALKGANEKLKEFDRDAVLFQRKEISEDGTPFRPSPPTPRMNGLPYLRVVTWWFGKKPVISWETFGKRDTIQEELDEASNSDDKDVRKLAEDPEQIKKDETYWYPGWVLKYKLEGKELKGVIVVDKCSKILNASRQIATEVNDIIGSRIVAKIDSPDGIADRELGRNIMLTRTKTGSEARNVKYKATLDEEWIVPEKYFSHAIDPYEYAKALAPLPSYQRAMIRELLYGEEIPEEVEAKEKARRETVKAEYKAKMQEEEAAAKSAPTKKAPKPANTDDDEDQEDDTEKKPVTSAKKSAAPSKSSKPAKDADDDDENKLPFDEDDDTVDEKPKSKAVAAKKSAPAKKSVAEDIEDDDEPKKTKAVAAKKEKVSEDLDDDDFNDD